LVWIYEGDVLVNAGCVVIADPSEILSNRQYNSLWDKLKKLRKKKECLLLPAGYAGGKYHVYVQKNGWGKIKRVLIDFVVTYGVDNNIVTIDDEYINPDNDPESVEPVSDDQVADDSETSDDDEKVVATGSKIIKVSKEKETPSGFLFAKKKKC